MKKLLVISLLIGWFNAVAQDERRVLNGKEFPIWYSKARILIKFKDPAMAYSVTPENLGDGIAKIAAIPGVSGMAFLEVSPDTAEWSIFRTVTQLRQHASIMLAHPVLLNEQGQESAGFTDLVIAKSKDDVPAAVLQAVFREHNLEVRPNERAPDSNLYLTGPAVLADPLGVCETLNQTGLFEYTQPNCVRFVKIAGTPNGCYGIPVGGIILSVNPNLTQTQVRRMICETAEKVGGYTYAVGNGATFADLSHNMRWGTVGSML